MRPVLVSACLLGVRCRYDGKSRPCRHLIDKLRGMAVVPICPEQLGGLPTPRPGQCFHGGDGHEVLAGRARVINDLGEDVTEHFLRGAREAVRLARLCGAEVAYLKSRSPSCGFGQVDIEGMLRPGDGVTAAALLRQGIRVIRVE